MTTYWHKHPRGFANECCIIRCGPQDVPHAIAEGWVQLGNGAPSLRRHIDYVNANMQPGQRRLTIDSLMHDREHDATYHLAAYIA